MTARDKRAERRLDQVDKRSQVGMSRATRARDVSRPDAAAIAEALHALEQRTGGAGVSSASRPAGAEAPPSPRSD